MKKAISDYTDPKALRQLMANATRLGQHEIAREAFVRLCRLEGLAHDDPLEREFYAGLKAYEELLTEKNKRTTLAARTRQKLARKSVVQCLEEWAHSSQPTQGFRLLIEHGLPELTAEYLVANNPTRFSDEAVQSARRRLADAGITHTRPS